MILVIGFLAGVITTASWLPQLIKTFRTRSAKDFSWWWLGLFATGVALWFMYGIGRDDLAIILANGVTLLVLMGITIIKLKGRGRY